MAFPFQVLQRRMAKFLAQPLGPGPFYRDAAFLASSFSPLNFAARALPRGKTGSGAAVRETATDPTKGRESYAHTGRNAPGAQA